MTDNLVKLKEWVDKLDHAAEESCFEGYSSGVPVRHLIDQIVDEMRVANESRIILEVTEETCPFRVKSYLQYDQSVIPNRCIILSPDEVKKVTEDEVDIQGGRAWVKNYIPRECNINDGCPLRMMTFKDIFKMFGYRSD